MSLFPETAERWARLERTAEVVADMIERAPVCTGPRRDGVEPDWTFDDEEEVTRYLASMRDDALFETHRYLGEDDEAEIIARRRLMAMR